MDQNQDFSELRNLLALKRLEMPADTEVNRFLIEFHRRQRVQLLVPATPWARLMDWVKARVEGLELVPSLSYASAFAAIAITACVGLSQQVQVTQVDGQSRLSFHMPTQQTSFAMLPTTFASAPAQKVADSQNFTPSRTDSTTRFVLASNTHGAYDATVAF